MKDIKLKEKLSVIRENKSKTSSNQRLETSSRAKPAVKAKPVNKLQALKKAPLNELNQKLKKALEDNLYLRADFENFKRRSEEEKSKLIRYSGEGVIISFANEVLDDLERAMLSFEKETSIENLKKGLSMIQKKISQVLSQIGVQVLDPTGEVFDPSSQEALSYIESSQVPEGHVAKTFKKTYKLHDKVIRPAKVVLAKKKSKN